MNKVNDFLTRLASQGLVPDDDVAGLAMNPDYKQSVRDGNEIPKVLKDRFKDKEKEAEEFKKETQKTENKPKGTKEMKKMKLSESLFEDVHKEKYIVIKKDGSYAGAPCESEEEARELSNQHEGSTIFTISPVDKGQKINEASAVLERPSFYYKKKREPLPDIIQKDLTSGEIVYKESPSGKLIPTHAPSLNLDEREVGSGVDDHGTYVIAWVPEETDTREVEEIAMKYGKEFKSGKDKYVIGNKYFTKIYVNDADWDKPYFDPDAPVRSGKEKDIA